MNNPQNIRLILADDHEIMRVGLKRLLSLDKSITILAEANNGLEASEMIDYYKPDIALLDILMPIMTGIEATKVIKENNPDTNCVILTAFEDSEHIEQALDAGADGYLSKDIGSRELIGAVQKVMMGERVFSKSILSLLQKKILRFSERESSGSVTITKREQEIIDFVANEYTSRQIAAKLGISYRTVQTHRANIMKKLDVTNTAGIVRYAINK